MFSFYYDLPLRYGRSVTPPASLASLQLAMSFRSGPKISRASFKFTRQAHPASKHVEKRERIDLTTKWLISRTHSPRQTNRSRSPIPFALMNHLRSLLFSPKDFGCSRSHFFPSGWYRQVRLYVSQPDMSNLTPGYYAVWGGGIRFLRTRHLRGPPVPVGPTSNTPRRRGERQPLIPHLRQWPIPATPFSLHGFILSFRRHLSRNSVVVFRPDFRTILIE